MDIYKHHSYAGCIGEGFSFLAKQLFLVTRVMMPYFLVLSLFLVIGTALNTKINVAVLANQELEGMDVALSIASMILVGLTYFLANGRMFLLFRRLAGVEQSSREGENTRKAWVVSLQRSVQLAVRSLPYTVWLFLAFVGFSDLLDYYISFVASLSKGYAIATVIATLLIIIAAVVFLTPLVYTYYCRMMDCDKAGGFKLAYRKGFSNKGKIFTVTLLSLFVVAVASVILLLPGIVSINAYFSSVEGQVNFGDTVLIPASGYVAMIVCSTVSLSFTCLLSMIMHTALLYLHGDIFTKQ